MSDREERLKTFDWHSDPITRKTPITATYRNTQNVRRFFRTECGDHFKFDRAFMEILVERLSMANLRLSGV